MKLSGARVLDSRKGCESKIEEECECPVDRAK